MKGITPKILKIAVAAVILIIILIIMYIMVEYRTFGGPRLTRLINSDFTYLETYFQEEPEEVFAPATSTVPKVKVPIIIYHSVRPYVPGESIMQDRFDITPELFEQQLAYLQTNGYTTITPGELARDIKTGTTTPASKPVLLTFDDGWENQYKYAFPLLKKYHMVATFYVYTKPIDRHRPSFLTWDQLREMSAAGMTIGSHTLSHPLFKHSTPEDIKWEISESKKVIENEIKKPVSDFAQPFGFSNPEIEQAIREAGYTTARGTYRGVFHSPSDQYNLQGYFTSDNFNEFVYILGIKK